MAKAVIEDKSLESWIRDAACSIRGAKDAPLPSPATTEVSPTKAIKVYILPLIFTKRLCDVYDDELNRIVAKVDELMNLCDRLKANLQAAQTTQLDLADSLVEAAIP